MVTRQRMQAVLMIMLMMSSMCCGIWFTTQSVVRSNNEVENVIQNSLQKYLNDANKTGTSNLNENLSSFQAVPSTSDNNSAPQAAEVDHGVIITYNNPTTNQFESSSFNITNPNNHIQGTADSNGNFIYTAGKENYPNVMFPTGIRVLVNNETLVSNSSDEVQAQLLNGTTPMPDMTLIFFVNINNSWTTIGQGNTDSNGIGRVWYIPPVCQSNQTLILPYVAVFYENDTAYDGQAFFQVADFSGPFIQSQVIVNDEADVSVWL